MPCSFVVKNGSNSFARVCSSMPVPVSDDAQPRVAAGFPFDQRERAAVSVDVDFLDADGHAAALRHRVARVDDEVQHDLLDLPGVGDDHQRLRRADDLEVDLRTDQPAQHRVHAAHDVAEREHAAAGSPAGG